MGKGTEVGEMQDVRAGARLQLCGAFVVEVNGRRVSGAFPGRQSRVLLAHLVLSRPHPVARDTLIDVLWGDSPPPAAGGALSVLVSKVRAAAGAELITGRSQLGVSLPEPTLVDVEVAISSVHAAESAVAVGDWRRAWTACLGAVFVARRAGRAQCSSASQVLRDRPTSHTRSSQDYRLGVPWASRPLITRMGGRGISRFSHMKVPYMPWFFDHAGSDGASR